MITPLNMPRGMLNDRNNPFLSHIETTYEVVKYPSA